MQTELIKELNKVLKAFPQFWSGEDLRGRLGNGQYCTVSLFLNSRNHRSRVNSRAIRRFPRFLANRIT